MNKSEKNDGFVLNIFGKKSQVGFALRLIHGFLHFGAAERVAWRAWGMGVHQKIHLQYIHCLILIVYIDMYGTKCMNEIM